MCKTTCAGTLAFLSFLLLLFSSLPAWAQNRTLSGQVISGTGQALSGVSVRLKNSPNVGTATDSAGNFSLSVPQTATLVVGYLGFGSQEMAVRPEQTSVIITLQAKGAQPNEVVVIGYGTASKRDLTGSITKISGRDVADRPNANPLASLQGKVAGLYVVNSGTPGQQPDIRIRGTVSIGGVRPLSNANARLSIVGSANASFWNRRFGDGR